MATLAYTSGTVSPVSAVPLHACDCHIHVYDARFPAGKGVTLLPPDASITRYRVLQKCLDTSRAVLVTPSTYDTDSRSMLAGLAEMQAHVLQRPSCSN